MSPPIIKAINGFLYSLKNALHLFDSVFNFSLLTMLKLPLVSIILSFNKNFDVLSCLGSIKISKYSYQNYWFTDQITLYDSVGNERYVNGSDVGFKVYFDNPLSDTVVPTLVV